MKLVNADKLQACLQRKVPKAGSVRWTRGYNDALLRFKSMVSQAPAVEVVDGTRLIDADELVAQLERKKPECRYRQEGEGFVDALETFQAMVEEEVILC